MKLEQAVKALKVEYLGDSSDIIEAKKIAVDAIEKQIPKPVVVTEDLYYFCPCCGGDDEAIRYDYCVPYKYCIECGQRLDWEHKNKK